MPAPLSEVSSVPVLPPWLSLPPNVRTANMIHTRGTTRDACFKQKATEYQGSIGDRAAIAGETDGPQAVSEQMCHGLFEQHLQAGEQGQGSTGECISGLRWRTFTTTPPN